jgi:hypothetical protein
MEGSVHCLNLAYRVHFYYRSCACVNYKLDLEIVMSGHKVLKPWELIYFSINCSFVQVYRT